MQKSLTLGILLSAFAAAATPTWTGDYETGNLSQWSEVEGLTSRLTIVQSPVRQGGYALRTELRNGDYSNGGCRNELVRGAAESEGDERYYAWSTLFPADYPSNNTWQVFTQWHHSGPNGSPPLEFDVQGERIQISGSATGETRVVWTAPLVRGAWHDFVIHVRFSANDGFIELWYDGAKVLEKTSMKTLYPGQTNYLKQGLYRDASIAQTAVLYHDGMRVGPTLADVAPELAAPPPPVDTDAGTPQTDAGTPQADAGTPQADAGSTGGPPTGGADAGADVPPPAVVVSTTGGTGFPDGGCTSTGAGLFGLLGLAVLFVRRRNVA